VLWQGHAALTPHAVGLQTGVTNTGLSRRLYQQSPFFLCGRFRGLSGLRQVLLRIVFAHANSPADYRLLKVGETVFLVVLGLMLLCWGL
jgi:hypothetical protein